MAQNDGQSYKEVRNSPVEKSKRRHAKSNAVTRKILNKISAPHGAGHKDYMK